jgi:hypothetical protein
MQSFHVEVLENCTVHGLLPATEQGTHRALTQGELARSIDFDECILATGFKVDVTRLDYLSGLLSRLTMDGGFPKLTDHFESVSVPGLFFVGLVAAQHFGPYMGFTASCPFAARVAVDAVVDRIRVA